MTYRRQPAPLTWLLIGINLKAKGSDPGVCPLAVRLFLGQALGCGKVGFYGSCFKM